MSEKLNMGVAQLTEWFSNVQRLTEASLFSVAPEGALRDAVVLDVLRRNARMFTAYPPQRRERSTGADRD